MQILYTALLDIGVKDDEGKGELSESRYLEKFRQNLISIEQKDDWKYSGTSAKFQGQYHKDNAAGATYSVGAVCAFDEDYYIYSAVAKSGTAGVSGIIKKSYSDGSEQYIVHRNKDQLFGLDYDGRNRIATSISSGSSQVRDIAVYNTDTNDFGHLTSGDSVDDNPYFCKCGGRILFDSRGIGRNSNMQAVGYSESVICAITESRNIEEVASEAKYDLLAPKEDSEGNIYYIRKPYKKTRASKGAIRSFADFLLMPFWLIYGIVRLMFFAADVAKKSSDRKRGVSEGSNPYVEDQKSERELYIQGELIDIQKEEKRNKRLGDKAPGFAPKSFELWRSSSDGIKVCLAKGVLDYDVLDNGRVVYTNGRYVFLLSSDTTKKTLFRDKLITKIRVRADRTSDKAISLQDPFGI